MIQPIFQAETYQVAKKLLDASVLRQEAISANISNVETPGYHRVDVAPDFAAQLKATLSSGKSLDSLSSLKPTVSVDSSARTMRPDGNTVELDSELVHMNENTVQYEYLTDLVSRNIRQLRMAITGRSA
jgi:flagellar basal-body rod protein FlgB